MKWNELTNQQLDVAVAHAEVKRGFATFDKTVRDMPCIDPESIYGAMCWDLGFPGGQGQRWLPTTDPHYSWPIIEREGIAIGKFYAPIDESLTGPIIPGQEFGAISHGDTIKATGPSMLVAAMLVYLEQTYGPNVPEVAQ